MPPFQKNRILMGCFLLTAVLVLSTGANAEIVCTEDILLNTTCQNFGYGSGDLNCTTNGSAFNLTQCYSDGVFTYIFDGPYSAGFFMYDNDSLSFLSSSLCGTDAEYCTGARIDLLTGPYNGSYTIQNWSRLTGGTIFVGTGGRIYPILGLDFTPTVAPGIEVIDWDYRLYGNEVLRTVIPGCGNGIVEPEIGEDCDGSVSCESIGYAGGEISNICIDCEKNRTGCYRQGTLNRHASPCYTAPINFRSLLTGWWAPGVRTDYDPQLKLIIWGGAEEYTKSLRDEYPVYIVWANGVFTVRAGSSFYTCSFTPVNWRFYPFQEYGTSYHPPSVSWNWTEINTSYGNNHTTICVNASEICECTLDFNGTDYVNDSFGTNICWTLTGLSEGNYSTIYATCDDIPMNSVNTTEAWLLVDTTPPTISWISRQNQTIIEDYHSFLVFIDEPANCTLYLDGAAYTNPDKSIAALWNITSLVDGNYTTINVTCEDQAQNDGYSTQAWLVVDTPDDEEPPSEIVTIIITPPKTEIPEEPEPEEDSGASDEASDNIIPQKYEESEEDAETTEEPSEPLAEPKEEPDFLTSLFTDPVRFGLLLLIVIILVGAVLFLRRK